MTMYILFLKFAGFLFDHLPSGWFYPRRPLFWILPYVGENAYRIDYPEWYPGGPPDVPEDELPF